MGKSSFEVLNIAGFPEAIEGMRAPLKSYDKSDSEDIYYENFDLGKNDYKLAKQLCKAGPEHRKWMRQVQVWLKIKAPIFWWSEFDTYKIGTSTNSESTMHTILKSKLTLKDFDTSCIFYTGIFINVIETINNLMDEYNKIKTSIEDYKMEADNLATFYIEEKINVSQDHLEEIFLTIKSLLPSSFLQTRYVNLNYETLHNIYHQRKNHRLPQWKKFCDFIEQELPYSDFITEKFIDNN